MKMRLLFTAGMIALVTAAFAWNTGNRILGQWSDGMWYPAKIAGTQGNGFGVVFDDGDQAILTASQIKKIDWKVGTRVQCNFRRAGMYYWGTIASMNGESIHISYDDGDQEDATISLCRSR